MADREVPIFISGIGMRLDEEFGDIEEVCRED